MRSNPDDVRWPAWRLVLLGASAVLLAASASMLLAWLTDGQWADLAGWFEATATLAAFGAAVAVGVLVARTLHIEQQRERDRLDADRKAQASLVAAWVTQVRYSMSAGDDGFDYRTGVKGLSVMVRNASPVPATNAVVNVSERVPPESGDGGYPDAWQMTTGTIPGRVLQPTEEPIQIEVPLDKILTFPDTIEVTQELVAADVEFTFTDAAGIRWRRDQAGLHEVDQAGRRYA